MSNLLKRNVSLKKKGKKAIDTLLDELYQEAEDNGIFVASCPFNETKSMIVNVDGGAAIGLNSNLISNYADEKYCMAHELGHYHTSSYYGLYSPLQLREKAEYKADTWMIKRIIPIDDLLTAIDAGYTEVWELAEYFDVPEKAILRADEIYRNKGLFTSWI